MATTMPPPMAALAAAAAEGKRSFVAKVMNDYTESTGRSVPDEVEEFVLQDVLVPDSDWDARRFDPDTVAQILHESLEEMHARRGLESASDQRQVHEAFVEVIDKRWRCPFPFIFC